MPDDKAPEIPMAGGVVSSSKIPGYHLMPAESLRRIAERFDLGVERKGDKAWNALSKNQSCLTDRDWALERLGHVIGHAIKLQARLLSGGPLLGAGIDDDAAALGWSAMYLCCATRAMQDKMAFPNCACCGGTGKAGEWSADHKWELTQDPCSVCHGTGKQSHP